MTENRIRHVQLPTFRIIVHNFANGCINRQDKFDRSLPLCKNFSVTFPMKTVCDTTAIRIWRYTQYVAAAVTTLADAILWINEVASIWIFAIFFWLFLTAGIVSIVSFFVSLRCNTQHRRILLIWHCANILVFVLWYVNPNDRSNADIMERHYEKYHTQMDGLHRYVIDQLNPGCSIDLEFEHGRITIFHVKFQTGKWKIIGIPMWLPLIRCFYRPALIGTFCARSSNRWMTCIAFPSWHPQNRTNRTESDSVALHWGCIAS